MKRVGKKHRAKRKDKYAVLKCDKKKTYYSSQDASRAAANVLKVHGNKKVPYRCDICGKWHLCTHKY